MATGKNSTAPSTKLKIGDTVMVIAGGSGKKRENKGKTGKILRFTKKADRVYVEGLNFIAKHVKAKTPSEKSEKIVIEGSIHISNLMFFAEAIKKPVRLKSKILADGKKVRGFMNPNSNEFIQV